MNVPATGSSAGAIYRALVGIGCVCALLIVTAYLLTGPVIAHNRSEALQRAIFTVLPGTHATVALRREKNGNLLPAEAGERPQLFLGVDDRGHMTGVAIAGAGMGYQDVIRLLYGYSPVRGEVVGMKVLQSRETPGLGDRILHDAEYLAAFAALAIPLATDGSRVLHPVEAVTAGRQRQAWQIDAITGATISSRAVANIIAESSAEWIPLVQRQQETLERMARNEQP